MHRNFYFVIFISVILIAITAINRFALKKRVSRELEEKNKEIELRNKNITDSINYALRIQNAKLPKIDKIYATFPFSFILYKPKDIVSGDFYFFREKLKTFYIATADCTGHGVLGALMSMVGMEKLFDSIEKHERPSDILKSLNIGLKTSLNQTESDDSTRDGMDIALCSINIESRTINFSGANRPIWIIKKGAQEITEIKGNKCSIGGHTNDNQEFTNHQIKLDIGDSIYLCSDGYADLFGGNDDKKFTTKRFKQLLLQLQDKSMIEQEAYLEDFMKDWKQVDDVLIIGLKFEIAI